MRETVLEWKNPGKTKIHVQGWWPDEKRHKTPRAIILALHGLGEHIGRYEHVAEFFTHHGYGFLGADRAGHGKSGGKRGHIKNYEYVFDDIKQLYNEATRRYPKVPVFLFGHSMGGGIVIDYLLQQKHTGLKGVFASAPMLEPAFKPNAALVFAGKLLRPILPGFVQSNQLDLKHLSKDDLVIEAYKKDPLVHDRISSEMGIGMMTSGINSLKKIKQVKKLAAPLLIVHGEDDQITSNKAAQQFAEAAPNKDVTFKLWPGGYHELHNDPDKLDYLNFLLSWIQERCRN